MPNQNHKQKLMADMLARQGANVQGQPMPEVSPQSAMPQLPPAMIQAVQAIAAKMEAGQPLSPQEQQVMQQFISLTQGPSAGGMETMDGPARGGPPGMY